MPSQGLKKGANKAYSFRGSWKTFSLCAWGGLEICGGGHRNNTSVSGDVGDARSVNSCLVCAALSNSRHFELFLWVVASNTPQRFYTAFKAAHARLLAFRIASDYKDSRDRSASVAENCLILSKFAATGRTRSRQGEASSAQSMTTKARHRHHQPTMTA